MDHHVVVLKRSRCLPNHVDYPLTFAQGAHDSIESAELSNAMCSDEDAGYAFGTSISIGSISSIELVGIAYHVHSIDLVDVVKKLEVEVARYTLTIGLAIRSGIAFA
jgi:hypothetical protein